MNLKILYKIFKYVHILSGIIWAFTFILFKIGHEYLLDINIIFGILTIFSLVIWDVNSSKN